MNCEQARQLFDAYLDGELSASLATELGAHRVQCPECRQALALLEVTGHIIASDDEPVSFREGFSERLLACMQAPKTRWAGRVRRALYIAGPIAAAAVIGLAFLGRFDSGPNRFAGEKVEGDGMVIELSSPDTDPWVEPPATDEQQAADRSLELWFERTRENLARKGQSGESLQNYLDMTILQWLDMLNEVQDESVDADHFPGADTTAPTAPELPPADGGDVEGL